MRYYELIYIINSNVERKKVDQVMKDIGARLENTDSKLINHTIWGKKKLAYPIKGNTYGTYILAHYSGGDNEKLSEFDSWLKLSGLTIRHMIVKLDKEPEPLESSVEDNSEKKKSEEVENKKSDDKIVEEDKSNNKKREEKKNEEDKEVA
ncbi:MAG: 30S ribosomal protein S6 [Candidatus Neomarinimicrobiota bacterium]